MELSDLDRLLNLMGSYWRILSNERQERQRLLVRVDEMQKAIQDLVERRDKLDRPQRPPLPKVSIATNPKPTPQTQRASSPKTNLPLRIAPASVKETTKLPQKSSVRPEIFQVGKGIKLPWKGKAIRVRLPKPPPATSNPTTNRTPFYLPLLAQKQTSTTKKLSTAAVDPSGTAPASNDDKAPALQKLPVANVFSEFRKALDSADIPASQSGSPSVFSFTNTAVSRTPPKFDFAAPPSPKQLHFNFDFVPPANGGVLGFTSALFGAPVGKNDATSTIALAALFAGPSVAEDKGSDTEDTSSASDSTVTGYQPMKAPRLASYEPSTELVPETLREASKGGNLDNTTEEKAEVVQNATSRTMQQSDDGDGDYDAGDEEDGGGA